jgi:hypothetical protein
VISHGHCSTLSHTKKIGNVIDYHERFQCFQVQDLPVDFFSFRDHMSESEICEGEVEEVKNGHCVNGWRRQVCDHERLQMVREWPHWTAVS